MTINQAALQVTGIIPSLTVDDLPASIAFYEALGFTVTERWDEDGTLVAVMMRAGHAQMGLSQDDWKKGRDRTKGIGIRMILETTQDIDDLAARARNAGITLVSDPHDSDWKGRAFEVRDPSGFLVTIFSERSERSDRPA